MATATRFLSLASVLIILLQCVGSAEAQLRANFYSTTCPNLQRIVLNAMRGAVRNDPRLPASMIRLFFHDCFVQGCDASVLLADTATFTGEQNAFPNRNSIRGMDVIETIKSAVEASCNTTVSCANILALATRDGVSLSGGPSWTVPLGRRDARTASQSAANSNLPGPGSSLSTLVASFSNQGLNLRDLVALSGAHTFGFARCATFRNRIYNDANIEPAFATSKQANCPRSGGDTNLEVLDVRTPRAFDNAYYGNLVARRGLLHSDQELFNNGSADSLGCDASVLLADTATFTGGQNAFPNRNSIRGMDVIETIKSAVEASCNSTVSCADILALATRDGISLSGGPSWTVPLGRRDARTASQSAANTNLPNPGSSLSALVTSFSNQGLNLRDLVALSGAHTIGLAQCATFRTRIYNDANIEPAFATSKKANCPRSGGDTNLDVLDVQTPRAFDNAYYGNLLARRGLLHSDQELFNNGSADPIVRTYASNRAVFFRDFVAAMIKMGNISPLTGSNGEIRRVCSRVN